ncbi:hypothetical protein ACWOAQ_08800 [Helcococcus kunzii]|uniref:Lipoprotein n=1 Tax=Helcococcus kunzii ATCC 51366 TaxID=883114 RepID=H3NPZ5_9FIRM|nr:hypothetical protein [Helcococcus kunzii]EHR32675.1 hypothetical protein HMPREF9709_01406 [Helcococcus kunzii ATCC 51366]QUY65296.1 hypothetical protein GUI37_07075 [Helcococcus kunzii]QZO75953.1 hypothetical protein HIF96_06605 [Helcococcus kunzii]
MKKLILLIVLLSGLIFTGCKAPDLTPPKEELDKVSLEPTIKYDETKVSDKAKELIDKRLSPDKEYSVPEENPIFKLKLSKDLKVTQGKQGDSGYIAARYEAKEGEKVDEQNDFVLSIIPFDDDYSPKAFYYMYSETYPADIAKIEGMELAMFSTETGEFISEFLGKDKKYYVITIKSKMNIHENIYLMNKLIENFEK